MPDEADKIIDDILSRWHTWASDGRVAIGYASVAAGFGQYRPSRQYDSENGACDSDIEARIMQGVDSAVNSIRDPYRTALHINARNLVVGVSVWRSERLPQDTLERARIVADARAMLVSVLYSRGLM